MFTHAVYTWLYLMCMCVPSHTFEHIYTYENDDLKLLPYICITFSIYECLIVKEVHVLIYLLI